MTDETPTVRTRLARWRVSRTGLIISLLTVAVTYLLVSQVITQLDANVASEQASEAQQDAESVADPLDQVCRDDEEIRRRLGELCDKAAEVKDQPSPPQAGQDGKDGRGIAGTAIADGRLLVTYTDGVVEDKGPITSQGAPGRDGRSIVGAAILDGTLVLSYSDGAVETVGPVVGADGADGEPGRDGRGVSSVSVSADYRLLVTYTDGDTVDVGPLPAGKDGADGRGIASVAFDMDTCTATVTYSDGTSEPAPMTGCPEDETPPDPAPLLPGG